MLEIQKVTEDKMKKKKDKLYSFIQIIILVVAVFAFAWMVGSSAEVVSAGGGDQCATNAECSPVGVCDTNSNTNVCIPNQNAQNIQTGISSAISTVDNTLNLYNSVKYFTKEQGSTSLGDNSVEVSTGDNAAKVTKNADPIITGGNKKQGSTPPVEESDFKWGDFLGDAAAAIAGALAAKYLINWALSELGVSEGNYDVLDTASWVGAGLGAVTGIIIGLTVSSVGTLGIGAIAAAVVVVVTAIVAGFTYQDYSGEVVTYTVGLWQPPEGGKNCEKCNELSYGCSEYQCRSFGQACLIANPGTTDEKCVWNNSNDKLAPEITLWDDLLDEEYLYRPIQVISPPDHGARVIYNQDQEGCIPPYTNLTLGFITDEPAYCKVDLERKANFSELGFDMNQGNSFVYNHSLFLPSSAFPSSSALNSLGLTIDGDKDYYFYFMCKDFNGNSNTGNFVMQFCTDMGPDERAPLIEGTNYIQDTYVQYGQTEAYLEVYTDEPADCRWDFLDLEYDNLNYGMSWCSSNTNSFVNPSTLTYGCKGNLEGLKNNEDNIFYIKCKDQPWLENSEPHKRNANKQSYILSLMGSYPLVIDKITVNGKENNSLIKDATDVIDVELKVKTSGGTDGEGLARCQYKIGDNYYFFYNEGSFDYLYTNTQTLFLTEGEYNYPIRCIDKGGNIAESGILFTVEKDVSPPEVVRVYYEDGSLKLVTDEAGECVYSLFIGCGFNFEDGNSMQESEDNLNHFIEWSTGADLFIKCKDKYGNIPVPSGNTNICTIVVRGSDY